MVVSKRKFALPAKSTVSLLGRTRHQLVGAPGASGMLIALKLWIFGFF